MESEQNSTMQQDPPVLNPQNSTESSSDEDDDALDISTDAHFKKIVIGDTNV